MKYFICILVVVKTIASEIAITNDDISNGIDDGSLTSAKIVDSIRKIMNDTQHVSVPIQAYIIPSVDAHQNEFPTDHDNRVQYVSHFTGSTGTIVIEERSAALWVESRYYSQAEKQVDNKTWTVMKSGAKHVPTLQDWLLDTLPESSRVGIDPFLIESKVFHELNEFLESNGHKLVTVQQNLVDVIWKNQPELKLGDLEPIEYTFSGKKIFEKLDDVRKALKELKADSLIITSLEDVAWLLNLRGSDFEYTPLFFAYVIIAPANETYLYLLDKKRATDNNTIQNHFYTEHIDINTEEHDDILAGINSVIRNTKGKVLMPGASEAIVSVVTPERRIDAENPISIMRTIKNDVEAKGIREAFRRDSAAIIRYLYWLETEIDVQNITELSGAEKLESLRKTHEYYRRLSFETISAVGSHASMSHYTPTEETDKQITREEIYLFDVGTQYKDGTTDITRTVHFGKPRKKEIDAFTRILKGFISVATAIFPPDAPFSFFDAMARRALWDAGLDYSHSTGHGIGAYLNVHEIPPLLNSYNIAPGMRENMFTSNEPGFYEDGKLGIRIENVLQVVKVPDSSTYFDDKGAFGFDDITMVPIQTKLIDVDLLTEAEIKWLHDYHAHVRKEISPLLGNDSNILDWLEKQTQPIFKKKEECEKDPKPE